MTAAIWRYDLPVTDLQEVDMPGGAEILPHVAVSDRVPGAVPAVTIWAQVQPGRLMLPRKIAIVGTGNPIPAGLTDGPYIGTVNTRGLIWHVFEVTSMKEQV